MSGCPYFSEHSRVGMNSQSHSHFLRLWFSGWLQSCDCLFPVLHYGKLLLAASRRSVSSCSVGRLLLLREEVLLVVHSDCWGRCHMCICFFINLLLLTFDTMIMSVSHVKQQLLMYDWNTLSFHLTTGGPMIFIMAWSFTKAYFNDVG